MMGVTCTIKNCVSLVFFRNTYLYNGGIGGYTRNNLSMGVSENGGGFWGYLFPDNSP